jgi:hypothetical protein
MVLLPGIAEIERTREKCPTPHGAATPKKKRNPDKKGCALIFNMVPKGRFELPQGNPY